jgi:hypothetical protein
MLAAAIMAAAADTAAAEATVHGEGGGMAEWPNLTLTQLTVTYSIVHM